MHRHCIQVFKCSSLNLKFKCSFSPLNVPSSCSSSMRCACFFVFFTALQCETNWTVAYTSSNVCALRGSTVNISVSYEYTHHKPQSSSIVKEPLWLTKIDRNHPGDTASDTHYKGRVEYNCGKNKCTASTCSGECTLTIKDLKLSDSAEYKFWITTAQTDWEYTGIPGVNLTVRGKLDNNILLM